MSGSNAGAWDAYWQKATRAGFQNKEAEHAEIEQFWNQFFISEFQHQPPAVMLELACGKGAVSDIAHQCLEKTTQSQPLNQNTEIEVRHYCLDYSLAAVKTTTETLGLQGGLVADGAALPIKTASADLIFSQFGIEYAGDHALINAAEILTPQGRMAAIIHHRDGLIYQHASTSSDALQQVIQSGVFELARNAFAAGFNMLKGNGSHDDFQKADRALSIPVRKMTTLLRQQGPGIADGIILQFYRDLGDMFNRMQAFNASDIINWLNSMEEDFSSHLQRMQSMLGAAYDKDTITQQCQQLTSLGMTIEECKEVTNPQGILGWQLIVQA
ncbi:class I SAM-dependent methyltransferase [Lacimicrobium alkaliphilum]|uniref:Methyltransferase type 11 domain-containing protein n=1 Tax=Lacimicrobium alkaliphilum TaxID=1526571 RepID=A0A0U3B7C5_9ALTE|nr:methyltransferase domain-containing protein [Lacimicrobium alkaliphilum]ALS97541.1 hypothetical protein AT746_04155 [Lacimicrobium alkaliphilum]